MIHCPNQDTLETKGKLLHRVNRCTLARCWAGQDVAQSACLRRAQRRAQGLKDSLPAKISRPRAATATCPSSWGDVGVMITQVMAPAAQLPLAVIISCSLRAPSGDEPGVEPRLG